MVVIALWRLGKRQIVEFRPINIPTHIQTHTHAHFEDWAQLRTSRAFYVLSKYPHLQCRMGANVVRLIVGRPRFIIISLVGDLTAGHIPTSANDKCISGGRIFGISVATITLANISLWQRPESTLRSFVSVCARSKKPKEERLVSPRILSSAVFDDKERPCVWIAVYVNYAPLWAP